MNEISEATHMEDGPRTVVSMALNASRASLKAKISVGHTKVKSLPIRNDQDGISRDDDG